MARGRCEFIYGAPTTIQGYGIAYARLDTDSENVIWLIRLSVSDVQKTDSFKSVSLIGI